MTTSEDANEHLATPLDDLITELHLSPSHRELTALRTINELEARDETVEVYILEAAVRDTTKVLRARKLIPGLHVQQHAHLKRVVKNATLPTSILEAQAALPPPETLVRRPSDIEPLSRQSSNNENLRPTSSRRGSKSGGQLSRQPSNASQLARRQSNASQLSRQPSNASQRSRGLSNGSQLPRRPSTRSKRSLRFSESETSPERLGFDNLSLSGNSEASVRKPLEMAHLFICPTSLISKEDLILHLQRYVPRLFRSGSGSRTPSTPSSPTSPSSSPEFNAMRPVWWAVEPVFMPNIYTINAPANPPNSYAQSEVQSAALWPVTYNPNTKYGPNPAMLATEQAMIHSNAGAYMALAREAGRRAKESKTGECVGAVIVERAEGQEKIVCIAGDGRFGHSISQHHGEDFHVEREDGDKGNPADHAVMRAIDMVAQKRRELAATIASGEQLKSRPDNTPLSRDTNDELEARFLKDPTNLIPDGYLCLRLEIYLSHEPCIMCSMALVHSRFARVVFGKRMDHTGGLVAEKQAEAGPNVRHGLFWREKLNWSFLCWEWVEETVNGAENGHSEYQLQENVHA